MNYKILTKLLANRLKKILPQVISEEQTCSVPQRTIFNNIFLTRDAITLNKEKNTNFYILQKVQGKLSKEIDHQFLYKKQWNKWAFLIFLQITLKYSTKATFS